jgi:hypothetical protein
MLLILNTNMSFLNTTLGTFERMPKEILPFMVELDTLNSFCKTCTYFYHTREYLTKTALPISKMCSFVENKESNVLEMSAWQFISLICSKTNFHKIFQHKSVLYGKIEEGAGFCCPFGTITFPFIREVYNSMLFNSGHDQWDSFFFIRYPKITFHMPSKFFENSYIPVYNCWWYAGYRSILSKMVDLNDSMQVRLTNVFIDYAIYCLVEKRDSAAVLELLKHNFPVLPNRAFFLSGKPTSIHIQYLQNFFKTPCLVDFITSITATTKGPLESTYNYANFQLFIAYNKEGTPLLK